VQRGIRGGMGVKINYIIVGENTPQKNAIPISSTLIPISI